MKDCRGGEYDETENTFDGCILALLSFCRSHWPERQFLGLYRIQTKAIQKNYGLEASDTQGVLSNSLQLMSRYTKTEYDEICKQAKADPEKLESVSYLTEVNTNCRRRALI